MDNYCVILRPAKSWLRDLRRSENICIQREKERSKERCIYVYRERKREVRRDVYMYTEREREK